jgi:DNA-binding response OmpR family regulator
MKVEHSFGNELLETREILKEFKAKKQNMTVLIVDDSSLIINKITEMLEDLPIVTDIKTSGTYELAVECFDYYKPDVVLLDINLPDKSGIEFLKYCKTILPRTVVIMVSNQSSEYYKNICLHAGASYFLDKSKDFEKIPSILVSLTDGWLLTS